MRIKNAIFIQFAFVPLTLVSSIFPPSHNQLPTVPQKPQASLPADILLPGIEAELSSPSASPRITQQTVLPHFRIPVLMYHYIRYMKDQNDKVGFSLSVRPDNFEKQAQYLTSHGFSTVTPKQVYDNLVFGKPLPPKPIMLTFDDGYADFYFEALRIVDKYNLKATLFIPSEKIGSPNYLTWDELRKLTTDPNIDIAGHTMTHINLAQIPLNQAAAEIVGSKLALQQKLGISIQFFAYPYGAFNSQVIDVVRKAGFKLAFSTISGDTQTLADQYTLHRLSVTGEEDMDAFAKLVGQ